MNEKLFRDTFPKIIQVHVPEKPMQKIQDNFFLRQSSEVHVRTRLLMSPLKWF